MRRRRRESNLRRISVAPRHRLAAYARAGSGGAAWPPTATKSRDRTRAYPATSTLTPLVAGMSASSHVHELSRAVASGGTGRVLTVEGPGLSADLGDSELAASSSRERLLLERVELGLCDRSIVEQFLPLGDLLGRIA
jgi:hypothetical protein